MSRKHSALKAMAEKGTVHEKTVAKAKLKNFAENGVADVPALPSEDFSPWIPRSELVQSISKDPLKEGFRYIRAANIKHFLDNVTEDVPFDRYTIPQARYVFETDKYNSVLNWLRSLNLVSKNGSKYTLTSKDAVREAWNRLVDSSKL